MDGIGVGWVNSNRVIFTESNRLRYPVGLLALPSIHGAGGCYPDLCYALAWAGGQVRRSAECFYTVEHVLIDGEHGCKTGFADVASRIVET